MIVQSSALKMVNGGEKAGSTDLGTGINEMVGKKKKIGKRAQRTAS